MPKNFKGKHYDLRPYVDPFGWIVIRRGNDQIKFKEIGNKTCWEPMCDHFVDRYTIDLMMIQFHTIKNKLLKEAGYVKLSEIGKQSEKGKKGEKLVP
jgi:hypothetical protein